MTAIKRKPDCAPAQLDEVDRRILNSLQGGFPVSEWPFLEAARGLGLSESELIERIGKLFKAGC